MVTKVVDASALIAVLFGEPEGPSIEDRLDGAQLAAPEFMPFEVANVCVIKMRVEPRRQDDWLRSFRNLSTLGVELHGVPLEVVIELADAEKLTVYDASYLWLSRELGAELVTLDKRLRAAVQHGPSPSSP